MKEFENMQTLLDTLDGFDSATIKTVDINGSNQKSHVAIWNTSKNSLETIAPTSRAGFLQHQSAIGSVVNGLRQKNLECTGTINNLGGRVVIDLTFDNVKIKDPTGSYIAMGLRVENDYSKPLFKAEAYGFREKCSNGMLFGKVGIGRFSGRFDKIADLEKQSLSLVNRIMENLNRVEKIIINADTEKFQSIEDLREAVYAAMMNKRLTNEITGLLEDRELSKYNLYNVFTQYATEFAETEKLKNKLQRKAQDLLLYPIGEIPRLVIPTRRRGRR